MSSRTIRTTVHFHAPFSVAGIGAVQAAGDYAVDHDEEPIEGLSWLAYRRVATLMHLPAIGAVASTRQMIAIDPDELRAALERDAETQETARPLSSNASG